MEILVTELNFANTLPK